jgi:hypothetical protein
VFQLEPLGICADTARQRVRRGRWHRIHRAVYSPVPESVLTPKGRRMAAVLACGPGAFVCTRSAAAHLNLRAAAGTRIDVGVPHRITRRHKGIRIHRLADIRPDEVEVVDGIPCTTVARTLLDLAAALGTRTVERTLGEAEVLDQFDAHSLAEQLRRHPNHRGGGTLRSALHQIAGGLTVTQSWFEERMMELVDAAGLPRPRTDLYIDPGDGELLIQPDFYWPEHRLVVETDGWHVHRKRASFERNRRNDQRLTLLDIDVLRFTDRQFENERPQVEQTISALLGRATASPPAAAPG